MGVSAEKILEDLDEMQATLDHLSAGVEDAGETDEDPFHDDENEALKADARVMLRELLADHLAAHLAREYQGRPEEITVPRVNEYMGQLTDSIQSVLADASWMDELARTAIFRARKSA
jgi:hypothetical protein